MLGLVLRKLRQPKVIAEVLGGIILGPTAFGRIPGFTEHIFPEQSLSYLSLVANIGLVLFLFIIGLEIETDVIRKNGRGSGSANLQPFCGPEHTIHAFHALHLRGILNHSLPSTLPNSNRAEPYGYDSRHRGVVCRSR